MSRLNWLQSISRLVMKTNHGNSRRKFTRVTRVETEALEPRSLLTTCSVIGFCPVDDTATDSSVPEDPPDESLASSENCDSANNSDCNSQPPPEGDEKACGSETNDTTDEEVNPCDRPEIYFRNLIGSADESESEEELGDDSEAVEDPTEDSDETESSLDDVSVIFMSMGAPSTNPSMEFSLEENSAGQTFVGSVADSGAETASNISYSIVSGNEAGTFAIDDATGVITVANNTLLDFESNPTLPLTVQRTDSNDPNSTVVIEVTISLSNVNEAPVLSSTEFLIEENSADAVEVGDLFASDPDVGSALYYSIVSGNIAGAFAINTYTGKITVANGALLNYESRSLYNLTVQVIDNGSPGLTTTANVTIQLVDVDDPPTANFSPTIAKYRIGDGAVRFATKSMIVDEDNPVPNFDGMVLSVSIIDGRSNKDVLSVKDSGSNSKKIVTRGLNDVVYGRTIIGKVEGGKGSDPLKITLNENATKVAVEALMAALSFSTKDSSTSTRTLAVQFSSPNGTVLSTATRSIPIKKKVEQGKFPGWGFF